jgi:hypothetical protein
MMELHQAGSVICLFLLTCAIAIKCSSNEQGTWARVRTPVILQVPSLSPER